MSDDYSSSTDSKTACDYLRRAQRCKKTGDIERAIKLLKVAKDIVGGSLSKLQSKHGNNAEEYFKSSF